MSSFLTGRKNSEHVVSVPRAVPPKIFEIATFIALGSILTGDLELRNGVRIDGIVRGRVEKLGGPGVDEVTVHVAPTGEIHGDIVADNVIIEGLVVGQVRAIKHLIVKGRISGSASYGESVELTGEIEANISRLGHMEARDVEAAEANRLEASSRHEVNPEKSRSSNRSDAVTSAAADQATRGETGPLAGSANSVTDERAAASA